MRLIASLNKPSFGRRATTLALAGLGLVGGSLFGSVQAATTPFVGRPCETLGEHAESTALDCVVSPGGQTWEIKGTRLNPYKLGEVWQAQRYVGAKWIPGYAIKVTAGNADASADVTLSAGAIKKKVVPAGWKPVTAAVEIILVGRQPAPSAGLTMKFVDRADKAYSLYVYKKGDLSCTGGGVAKQINAANLTQNNGTITGNVCSFVDPAAIDSSLLMRVQVRSVQAGRTYEAWYTFL